MIEMQIRRTTVLADAHDRRRASQSRARARRVTQTTESTLVHVGATTKEWTYTDGNGKEWEFADRADDVPAGQRFVGSTDAYPESTYKFYEPTSEALAATVEKIAKSQASGTATFSVGGGEEPAGGGGQAPTSTTSTTPPTGTSPGAATTTTPGTAAASPPAGTPAGGGGLGRRFSSLSTLGKVGVVALVVLASGGIVWAVI